MNQSEIIGNRIKEERLKRKLTLKQLSEMVGLSIGYLSQVERGYGTLSLNALEKLSAALDIEICKFFDHSNDTDSQYVIHSHQRNMLQVSREYIQYSVTLPLANTAMRATVFEVYPTVEEEHPIFSHEEEEILYVLEGTLLFTLDKQEYVLNPGDCVHIPPHMEHSWKNPSAHTVKIFSTYL